MNWKSKFLILIVFALLFKGAYASIVLNKEKEVYFIGKQISYLEDKKGTLDYKKVRQLPFKKSEVDVLNFGQTNSTYWAKFEVLNDTDKKQWLLLLKNNSINEVIVFKMEDGKLSKEEIGSRVPYSKRLFKNRNFVFPLNIEKKGEYYIKVRSLDPPVSLPLKIYSNIKFAETDSKELSVDMIFYGMIIIMALYNFFIYFSTRMNSYLFYSAYLVFFALHASAFDGLGFQYLYPESPWGKHEGWIFFVSFTSLFFSLFSMSFLDLEKESPRINFILKKINIVIGTFICFHFLLPYLWAVNLALFTPLLAFGPCIIAAIILLKNGDRKAIFYVTAFSSMVIFATLSIIYITGALPEWFIFKNGAKIGITIQFTLLSLGLADVINALRKEALNKAENLNKAKLVLADLNKNLEDKVLERTKDLNFALKEVENLLNNMRQAVFTADKDGTILSPVSIFSETIFEGKVQNQKINETIFKGIDKKSEAFSTIHFSYTHIFGADDLQWEMVKDHFPRRVIYKSSTGNEKVLKVTYTPLWDQNNLLNRVMFIVEDITEIEKLEKEMEEQKLTSLKNIQILQELASNKKDDLHSFFSKTNQTLFDATYLAKKMRSLFETTKDLNELHLFYRHLHTIKGNARVFNLGFVSKYSHKIESDLIEVMEKCDRNEIVDPEDLNNLVQGMYDLQGQINEYLKAAKDVFSLEFDEDKKYKEKLHDLVKNLEHWSSQLFLTCVDDPTQKITVLKENILDKMPYRDEIIQELKDLTHSLKGLARCLGEREISEEVHFFEGAILSFYDSEEKMDIQKFTKFILNPLGRIKDLSYNIFLGAQKFNNFENTPEKWSLVFTDIYEIDHFIRKNDLKEISQKVYNLHVTMAHMDMYFLPAVTNLLFCIMSVYGTSVKMVSHIMKVSMEYLVFLCSLDNNKFYTKEERTNIVKILTEGQDLSTLSFLERDSIFITFLKKVTSKKYNYGDVLSDISRLLEVDKKTLITDIFPQKDYRKPGEDLFYELKKSFSLSSINSIQHLHKKDGEFFINFKKWFCKDDDLGIGHYLKRVDLAKILKTFCVTIDTSERLLKPKTYDVLIENYHQCFENLLNKAEKGHHINLKMINQTFAKLLYLPIKHSFYKFSSIVEDVSAALGKKINFRISGDQGGLEKDRLALLQDALIHLVRNSIDHGIETPSERISREKAQMGTIEINCHQVSAEKFQISLKDDGNGIDTHKLVQKGLEKDLIKSEELSKMSEEDKLNLMFLPNLSTKESVSEISGRGVGMEVVSNNLRDLGATLDINTINGKGTEFIININLVK